MMTVVHKLKVTSIIPKSGKMRVAFYKPILRRLLCPWQEHSQIRIINSYDKRGGLDFLLFFLGEASIFGKKFQNWKKFQNKDLELDFCLLRCILAKLILNPSGKKGDPFAAVKETRRLQ